MGEKNGRDSSDILEGTNFRLPRSLAGFSFEKAKQPGHKTTINISRVEDVADIEDFIVTYVGWHELRKK